MLNNDEGSSSSTQQPKIEIPNTPVQYLCPILTELMQDPVIASDGYTYERSAITQWLERNRTSPITRQKLNVNSLTPNRALKELIEKYQEDTVKVVKNPSALTAADVMNTNKLVDLFKEPGTRKIIYKNEEIIEGVLVPQIVVAMAGIYEIQSANSYYKELNSNYVIFNLKFTENAELSKFIKYYSTTYNNIILNYTMLELERSKISFDATLFYEVLALKIADFNNYWSYQLNNKIIEALNINPVSGNKRPLDNQIVNLAGIQTIQGPSNSPYESFFGRYTHIYTIFMRFKFNNSEERTKFIAYYDHNYPELIRDASPYIEENAEQYLVRIHFNPEIFEKKLLPKLAEVNPPKSSMCIMM